MNKPPLLRSVNEKEAIKMKAEGASNREIAKKFDVSDMTVSRFVNNETISQKIKTLGDMLVNDCLEVIVNQSKNREIFP